MRKSYFMLSAGLTISLAAPVYAFGSLNNHGNNAPNNSIIHISSEQTLEEGAFTFVSSMTKQGIDFLADSELSEEQRTKEFHTFLKTNFDMKTIARFVLGRYWRGATIEQKKEYLRLFETMIVDVYATRFGEYNGEQLNVVSSRPDGDRDAIVSSEIVAENVTISVDWRIRKKKDGKFKVVDVIVEDVSMSLTQRSEFASVIQRGGGNVEVLLAHLRPK